MKIILALSYLFISHPRTRLCSFVPAIIYYSHFIKPYIFSKKHWKKFFSAQTNTFHMLPHAANVLTKEFILILHTSSYFSWVLLLFWFCPYLLLPSSLMNWPSFHFLLTSFLCLRSKKSSLFSSFPNMLTFLPQQDGLLLFPKWYFAKELPALYPTPPLAVLLTF